MTRLTLRTHDLPDFVGAVNLTIKAASDVAFRHLIGQIVSFYGDSLFNPHWGEQIAFRPGNVLAIAMVFEGLDQQQAEAIWRPFLDWLAGSPHDFSIVSAPWIVAVPAWRFWDPSFLKEVPGVVLADDRPGAPRPTCSGRPIGKKQDRSCMAISRHGFQPRSCSRTGRISRRCPVCGEPALERVAACQQGPRRRACRRHSGGQGHGDESSRAGCLCAGHQRRRGAASLSRHSRLRARSVGRSSTCGGDRQSHDGDAVRLPTVGSYVAESNFFEPAWQESFGVRTTRGCLP